HNRCNSQMTPLPLTYTLFPYTTHFRSTEKANNQMERFNRYSFQVGRQANKLEIVKAVQDFYGVKVVDIRTAVVPGKHKSRFTKRSEEHTSELQSRENLVCRLLLEKIKI